MSIVVYWSDKSWLLIDSVMSWWHEKSIKYAGNQFMTWNCGSSPDMICCPVQRPNHITIILIQWFQIKLASHQLPSLTHPRRFLVWPRFRFRAVVSITLRSKTKRATQEVFLLLDAHGIAGRMHHTFTRETFIIFWRASCILCFSRCGYMCSWSRMLSVNLYIL